MSISDRLLPEFDQEMKNTRKVLSAVPDSKWDWKPHEKSMSLGVLTGHIADMASWGTGTMNTESLTMNPGDYKPYIPASTTDLVATFEKSQSEFRELLAKADDEAFAKNWAMTWNGTKVIDMPRIAVIRGMVMNHMIHHRGQLTVYLRLLGAAVPGTYGPTADETN